MNNYLPGIKMNICEIDKNADMQEGTMFSPLLVFHIQLMVTLAKDVQLTFPRSSPSSITSHSYLIYLS